MWTIISWYNIIGDNMIDEIQIKITKNLEDTLYLIDYKEQTCAFNQTIRRISEEDLNEIMNYMVLLNKEYGTDGSIDGEEFTITVNKEVVSHGKGICPQEYLNIKNILGGINVW